MTNFKSKQRERVMHRYAIKNPTQRKVRNRGWQPVSIWLDGWYQGWRVKTGNKYQHVFWTTTFQELKPGDTFLDLDTRDDLEGYDNGYAVWVKRDGIFGNYADCIFCTEGTVGSYFTAPDRKVYNLTEASRERREWLKVREYSWRLEEQEND
jgi:hypothetical protein